MAPSAPAADPAAASLTQLMRSFGDRWLISYQPDLRVWSGQRRSPDGRRIRFITAPTPADLTSKLAATETGAPS